MLLKRALSASSFCCGRRPRSAPPRPSSRRPWTRCASRRPSTGSRGCRPRGRGSPAPAAAPAAVPARRARLGDTCCGCRADHDAVRRRLSLTWPLRRLFLLRPVHRAGDVGRLDLAAGRRKVQRLLRPGQLLRLRLGRIEDVAAVEHQPGDLQHCQAGDRPPAGRDQAKVAAAFSCGETVSPLALGKGFGRGGDRLGVLRAGLPARRSGSELCRAAMAMRDRRCSSRRRQDVRAEPSHISDAVASWPPRLSLHSRTVTFSPAIARSAISVAVISSPIVAFSDCSWLQQLQPLVSSMQ